MQKKKFKIKELLKKFKYNQQQNYGRSKGTIVMRHRGSPAVRALFTNFNRYKISTSYKEFVVLKLVYDSTRSALLALIGDGFGFFQFILAPEGLKVGSVLYYSNSFLDRKLLGCPGTNSTLKIIPTGSKIFNVERKPGQGGVFARSAGCFAKLMIKKRLFSRFYGGVLLPSKKLIYLPLACHAFLGRVSNQAHKFQVLAKAGLRRNLGIRPSVRGVAMNPIDHPHGGGEGKASTGPKPKTPWGLPAKWKKTTTRKKRMKLRVFITKLNKLAVSLATKKKKN